VSYTLAHQGNAIGSMTIVDSGEDTKIFQGIDIHKEYRGKGFGLAAYVLAIESAHELDVAFETDSYVSLSAVQVWNRLVHAGVAQVVEPFRYALTWENGLVYYEGLYRAAPGLHAEVRGDV
jgi:predicted GNAT family acetyltransferase